MTSVMLVEDDMTMLSLLETLLDLEGFQVLKPKDDAKDSVVSALYATKPDVVLMDVHLRHFNGLQLLGELRKDSALNGVRILISSGMDLKREALAAGANAFMLKPYMPDDLIEMIKQVAAA